MKKILITYSLLFITFCAQAQNFDMTKEMPKYSDAAGYGYDYEQYSVHGGHNPFFFSVKVPDGNYLVTVVLGSKKYTGETVVKAENRRAMTPVIKTKKGQFVTYSFLVNKRSPAIVGGPKGVSKVNIKEREKDYMTWDDRLTLEFNGSAPAVKSITVTPDTTATTIFLCGNSTVVDQSREPWCSWGQQITQWFGDKVCISNHAESGLTARTFLRQNRLEKILSVMKPGDYVFCEFGHNDEKEHYDGDGAYYHFAYNLKIFIDKVRKKGGIIVFCTPTQRFQFEKDNKTIRNTHGVFPDVVREVAARENVPVIDLNALTKTFFETLGKDEGKNALVFYPMGSFPGQQKELADRTHFSVYGAYEISKMVATAIKQQFPELAKELRPAFRDFDPSHPDDFKEFVYFRSPIYEVKKPDGN